MPNQEHVILEDSVRKRKCWQKADVAKRLVEEGEGRFRIVDGEEEKQLRAEAKESGRKAQDEARREAADQKRKAAAAKKRED